jgi:tRNA(fMet)-specific endonuclease VapC
MLQYMLDTDVCIPVIKGHMERLSGKFERLANLICISSIALAELTYGAEKSARRLQNLDSIAHFASRLKVLSFAGNAAAHYGQIRAELEKAGTPVGTHDMLIAAHARSEGLIVVTSNIREFNLIPGLRVESWL